MLVEIEKIFVDLIQQSLNLPANYGKDNKGDEIPCVTIKSQNIKLFTTPKLQITVATASSQVFSNRQEQFEQDGKYFERICLNDQRIMQIDMYSRNNEARQRFWAVQACLTSNLAQQLQDQYQFRIAKISRAINLSGLDGGSDINRYTIRFNCLSWHEQINEIDYYDKFQTQIFESNEKIADFNIEAN